MDAKRGFARIQKATGWTKVHAKRSFSDSDHNKTGCGFVGAEQQVYGFLDDLRVQAQFPKPKQGTLKHRGFDKKEYICAVSREKLF
jgi:hypothetical protein